MSMKKLLVLAALGTIIAAPAFAQQAPNARQQAGASNLQRSSTYAYERNGNANPDFQLGGSRWKTNKAKHAKRHASASQK
jgi:Ni/Co efflux regulator RcnB